MEAVTQVRYSVVIPLFNEQDNVLPLYSRVIQAMREVSDSYEIVFVDDGSRDQTLKVLSEICEEDPRVIVIRLRKNFGQTAALKAGFDFARGEVIISMDGDLQHDPAEIPAFVEKLNEGYDVVSGWRHERRDAWLTRQLPSRTAKLASTPGLPPSKRSIRRPRSGAWLPIWSTPRWPTMSACRAIVICWPW